MMEFDEMKKVWDSQNQKPMYIIDEDVLHNRIRNKKKKSQRLANISEYVFIISTIIAGSIILISNLKDGDHNLMKYFAASFFYLITGYLFYQRMLRTKEEQHFDQTMLGDLEHALSNATHQVRLSLTMMNIVYPSVSAIAILTEWVRSGFSWEIPAIFLFFVCTYFAARWEHSWYASKKNELTKMKDKLLEDPILN